LEQCTSKHCQTTHQKKHTWKLGICNQVRPVCFLWACITICVAFILQFHGLYMLFVQVRELFLWRQIAEILSFNQYQRNWRYLESLIKASRHTEMAACYIWRG
jgi:hypothetical protein